MTHYINLRFTLHYIMAKSPKFPHPTGNWGGGTWWWHQISDWKQK